MTYFVKNTSNETVIEPYFKTTLMPGETKELDGTAAERLLVLRPDACKLVSAPTAAPAKAVAPAKESTKKEDKE